jgi:hypothetical protein
MTDGTMSTAAVRFVLGALQPVGSRPQGHKPGCGPR